MKTREFFGRYQRGGRVPPLTDILFVPRFEFMADSWDYMVKQGDLDFCTWVLKTCLTPTAEEIYRLRDRMMELTPLYNGITMASLLQAEGVETQVREALDWAFAPMEPEGPHVYLTDKIKESASRVTDLLSGALDNKFKEDIMFDAEGGDAKTSCVSVKHEDLDEAHHRYSDRLKGAASDLYFTYPRTIPQKYLTLELVMGRIGLALHSALRAKKFFDFIQGTGCPDFADIALNRWKGSKVTLIGEVSNPFVYPERFGPANPPVFGPGFMEDKEADFCIF